MISFICYAQSYHPPGLRRFCTHAGWPTGNGSFTWIPDDVPPYCAVPMMTWVFTTYKLNHRTALDQISRSDIYCGSEWHPQDIPWVHDLLRQYILRVLVLKLKHATSSYTINDFGYHQHWMTSHQMGPIRGARLKQLARKPYTKYNFGLSLACSLYDFSDWFWHWKYGILSSIRSFITIQMVKCHVDVIMLPSVTICYHQNMFKLPSSTIS